MKRFITLTTLALTFIAVGCDKADDDAEDGPDQPPAVAANEAGNEAEGETADPDPAAPDEQVEAQIVASAVASMRPTEGNTVEGTVRFEHVENGVRVTADLRGLTANTTHGFHIHENGDCSAPDGTSAGGHYNPEGHDHAGPDADMRHAGDLGNVESDADGNARYEFTAENITIDGDMNPIMGKGVIVHADPDDLESQPTGAAGARVSCGVIEESEAQAE